MRENTVLKVFICITAAVFLVHQLYSSLYKPITTQSAEFYEAVDGLQIDATIIRNEHYVSYAGGGVMHFVTADGERVAKGGTIAQIYDNAQVSITVSHIEQLTQQIADIEDMLAYNDVQAADLELINGRVASSLGNLVYSASNGSFSTVQAKAGELLSAINRQQLVTGEQTDFAPQLEALKSELANLNASLPNATGYVAAPLSGYFVSAVDGFENVLKFDDLSTVTPEFLKDVKPEAPPKNVLGKIVSDYEWYIAANISINDSLKYKEGDTLKINTGLKTNSILTVTVKSVNISSDSDSATVIFACSDMSSELASMRSGKMTVISKTYSGLRLPKKSLRVVDGQTGVYVISGINLTFIPVNVIYSNDKAEYIICEQQQSTEEVLRLYDEVVVKGRNLYDGKIVG